ncbi:hypothetical protein FB451DRAFT_1497441 [Mycena latifolia]|nr:hypothetical protein FB451DRAFT_1497441 [Mycena latifolia]
MEGLRPFGIGSLDLPHFLPNCWNGKSKSILGGVHAKVEYAQPSDFNQDSGIPTPAPKSRAQFWKEANDNRSRSKSADQIVGGVFAKCEWKSYNRPPSYPTADDSMQPAKLLNHMHLRIKPDNSGYSSPQRMLRMAHCTLRAHRHSPSSTTPDVEAEGGDLGPCPAEVVLTRRPRVGACGVRGHRGREGGRGRPYPETSRREIYAAVVRLQAAGVEDGDLALWNFMERGDGAKRAQCTRARMRVRRLSPQMARRNVLGLRMAYTESDNNKRKSVAGILLRLRGIATLSLTDIGVGYPGSWRQIRSPNTTIAKIIPSLEDPQVHRIPAGHEQSRAWEQAINVRKPTRTYIGYENPELGSQKPRRRVVRGLLKRESVGAGIQLQLWFGAYEKWQETDPSGLKVLPSTPMQPAVTISLEICALDRAGVILGPGRKSGTRPT